MLGVLLLEGCKGQPPRSGPHNRRRRSPRDGAGRTLRAYSGAAGATNMSIRRDGRRPFRSDLSGSCVRFVTICRNLSRFTRPGGGHELFEDTKFDRECRFVSNASRDRGDVIGLESLPLGDFACSKAGDALRPSKCHPMGWLPDGVPHGKIRGNSA
jgi:hypothetical protein